MPAMVSRGRGRRAMNEINMVPFIDVMLVLLIIFIITVPVMKHAVNVELPRASNEKEDVKPETLRLTVQADGTYFLGDERIDDDQFARRLQAEAQKNPQPDLHIRGDRDVRYERVAQAMATAQQAGLKKIGFITEPPRDALP
jgi:biopolymer transport protein ExbD